nr:hypothetical protein [uncultured Acetatifactor sp.]
MDYFNYDKSSTKAEYYETLASLMERWEFEIVESQIFPHAGL